MTSPGTRPASQRLVTEETVDNHITRVGNATYAPVSVADDVTAVAASVATKADLSPRGRESLEVQRAHALRPFWAALGNRRAAGVNCVFKGHSFMEGVRAAAFDRTLPNLFADTMRALHPTPGVVGGFGSKSVPDAASWPDDALVRNNVGINRSFGWGRRAMFADAAGKTATWTRQMTGFDIVYGGGSTRGIGYYKVDGGAAVTFDTYGPTKGGNVVPVRGLTPGQHTVEIGWSSGGGVIFELVTYNGDENAGIRVFNSGDGSQQSGYWVASGNYWIDNLTPYPPHLMVISSMANDFGGEGYTPVPSATVKANLKTLIANVRAKNPTVPCSFVICTEYERSGASNKIEPWANYVQVAREVAAEDTGYQGGSSVLTFDMSARFGAGPFASGSGAPLVDSDNTHPAGPGYQLWADALARFVSPI